MPGTQTLMPTYSGEWDGQGKMGEMMGYDKLCQAMISYAKPR